MEDIEVLSCTCGTTSHNFNIPVPQREVYESTVKCCMRLFYARILKCPITNHSLIFWTCCTRLLPGRRLLKLAQICNLTFIIWSVVAISRFPVTHSSIQIGSIPIFFFHINHLYPEMWVLSSMKSSGMPFDWARVDSTLHFTCNDVIIIFIIYTCTCPSTTCVKASVMWLRRYSEYVPMEEEL